MQEHGRLNKQALLARKHVWSEKPMANTYQEGKALLDLSKKQGVRIWARQPLLIVPNLPTWRKQFSKEK
ncbi:MAG: Gfo/Idh/MocA family oxidoreductase [Cytophagales bacterium]|nr:Gfo/Idh/MocA family oxidoreductase [Cytophagales bacterium]